MRGATPTQARVLVFLADYLRRHRYAPTCRELIDHMGATSTNAGFAWLKALEKKELIRRTPKIARGLRITAKGERELALIASERNVAP